MVKKRVLPAVCAVLVLAALCLHAETPVTAARRAEERYRNDPLAVRSLHPTFDEFPDASLVDFSYLLDPPAGKNGFIVMNDDGHFVIEKTGERMRFWGVTVAASHIDISRDRIRLATDVIARSGCNLLRLHEIDNRGGENYNLVRRSIIDEAWPNNDNSRHFDPEYRDRVDYWIHCAQERGLYVYLVVRCYRTFRSGDGVAGADKLDRKAAPYGYFNTRLMELQDEYIEEWLFKHKNPYTGLPNGLNPAVCMIELINEDSLFFDPGGWINFIEPYRTEFQNLWNAWLKDRYGDTDKIRKAWTIPDGSWSALEEEENVENATVRIPDMKMRNSAEIKEEEDSEPLSHPLRQADGARFAADLQKRVFARQRDLIRSKGCPIPITAVVNSTVIPDTWSVAQELDFVGENAYQDHPAFKAGETWVGKSFFQNKNYLKDTGPWAYAAHMARYKWAGKGLVCREWALSWPNEYRASANMAMAAQALRQDYDGMIYFCYNTWGDQNISATFGLQADPARWGTFGYAGHLFIRGGVEPARQSVDIAWTEQNLFRWGNYVDALHDLAWEFRIANHFFPGVVQSEADIRVSAGRSGTGIFQGQRNILWDIRPERWAAYPEALRNSAITIRNGYTQPFVQAGRAMPIQDVKAAGYVPLAANEETCRGFYDPARKTAILAGSDSRETANAVRGLARAAQSGETMEIMPPPEKAVSEKGDVIRDTSQGFLTIRTPDLEALQGEFRVGERETAGALSVISRTPIGCVTALALDGKPLAESKHFAVKMVTGARNRGQVLAPSEAEGVPGKYVLSFPGTAPVQTNGQPSQEPTSVMIAGKPLIEAWLTGGMWEMIVDRQKGEIFLACDTPNISFQLGEAAFADGVPEKMKMTRHFYEHPPVEPVEISARFQYPGFAKYARIEMVGE